MPNNIVLRAVLAVTILLFVCSSARMSQDQTQESHSQQRDSVIFSFALSWDDLWREGASLEEVPQPERDEIVKEVLQEIGNKMKRRHKVSDLVAFNVKKVRENLALVEYPHLSNQSDSELNLIGDKLLQLGGFVLNVNIFVNNREIYLGAKGLDEKTNEEGRDEGQLLKKA